MEPVKYLEVKSAKPGTNSDSFSIVRASQVPSRLQLKDIAFPSSLSAIQSAWKPSMTSVPQPPTPPYRQPQPPSTSNSRPGSPYSRRPSPPRSATPMFSRGVIDSLNKTNELLNQEVNKLQNQLKVLKQKSEIQDAEIRKLQKNAQEAAALAAEKSSKCTVAKEVVSRITAELNEITKNLPPEISESENFKSMHAQVDSFLNECEIETSESDSSLPPKSESGKQNLHSRAASVSDFNNRKFHGMADNPDDAAIPETSANNEGAAQESNGSSASDTREGAPQQSAESGSRSRVATTEGRKEVIEQFEPGVYVTLIQLGNGTKIFKSVRFSKRKFSEQQAEEWWKENKDRLLKKYSTAKNIRPPTEPSAAPPPVEENGEAAASS